MSQIMLSDYVAIRFDSKESTVNKCSLRLNEYVEMSVSRQDLRHFVYNYLYLYNNLKRPRSASQVVPFGTNTGTPALYL